ncbi:uncharacterized protein LOC134265699 [Saccostrea cucullata]|uniref:uncharacterized protein LOC134265699 n=1 Tax=Saccostrea cuccullata TaxID=36930 RepID=UPI002ED2824C
MSKTRKVLKRRQLLVDVAFTNVLKHQKPSVSLRSINISFNEATDNIHCIGVNITYSKTDYVLSENDAEIKINYLKNVLENSKPAWMSFEIIVEFICKNRCIGISEYRISASISKQNNTITYNKTIQQPEIFHDVNNTLLSQLYSILDNDSTSCISLPKNGHIPPVFWIRIQTYWFDILPKRFILTLFGENLSCSGYNERSIQVSYPTSSSKGRFHGELRHCQLSGTQSPPNSGAQCTFLCPCTNPVECSEVFAFMAAERQVKWKLCEMSAISL